MMPSSHTADSTAEIKSPTGKTKKNAPYIPSYMDLSNGPEPCVVCTDAATGYHYRCMTCEGCKGFFRRTIQKGLRYHCKWNNNCAIDKTTRNQCQQCRFQKCLAMGMATDLVLNEKQRVAKRKLIEENRERRREEQLQAALAAQASPTNSKSSSNESTTSSHPDELTQADRILIDEICVAYDQTTEPPDKYYERPANDDNKDETWLQLAEIMTPSITKVVDFAKSVPGFSLLRIEDQISLLKSCCMEIMCLRAACRYEPESTSLVMQNGLIISRDQINNGYLGTLVGPIFEFAVGLSKLQLDSTEVALLAATLLLQHDRSGLLEPDAVEKLLDTVLAAFKRYVTETRPGNSVHFARTLMKVTDLRHLSTENAQNVLRLRLDAPSDLPPLFLEMFDEEPPTIIYTMLMDAPSPPHDHGYKM